MHIKTKSSFLFQNTLPVSIIRVQFLTIFTYNRQTTMGAIHRTKNGNIWTPSKWGHAATTAMEELQRFNKAILIEEYAIMPNHIHMLILYKSYKPKMTNWFVSYCKQYLSHKMLETDKTSDPIWEKSFEAQYIRSEYTQYILSQNLREHQAHWQYDPLYRPNQKNRF